MAKKCEYCFRPVDYRPAPGEGDHNEGCPYETSVRSYASVDSAMEEMGRRFKEWKAGYDRGFNWDHDLNMLEPWQYRYHSKTFVFGYRAGKAYIDMLVDEAYERNYNYSQG